MKKRAALALLVVMGGVAWLVAPAHVAVVELCAEPREGGAVHLEACGDASPCSCVSSDEYVSVPEFTEVGPRQLQLSGTFWRRSAVHPRVPDCGGHNPVFEVSQPGSYSVTAGALSLEFTAPLDARRCVTAR